MEGIGLIRVWPSDREAKQLPLPGISTTEWKVKAITQSLLIVPHGRGHLMMAAPEDGSTIFMLQERPRIKQLKVLDSDWLQTSVLAVCL